MFGYLLFVALLVTLLGLTALVLFRVRQSVEAGEKLNPLSPEDRLRISLALRSLEAVQKELGKAAWTGEHLPGHPHLCDLLYAANELSDRARKLLRES